MVETVCVPIYGPRCRPTPSAKSMHDSAEQAGSPPPAPGGLAAGRRLGAVEHPADLAPQVAGQAAPARKAPVRAVGFPVLVKG